MERVNIPGFGPGKVEIDVYTFDALPNTKFKRVGDAFQPILDEFYLGQPVWCELMCKAGVVSAIDSTRYPIGVAFLDHRESYTKEGCYDMKVKPTLRPLQKFNVGQRVKDGQGKEGVVISNTFKTTFPIMVQWDGEFAAHMNAYDTFTAEGNYRLYNSDPKENITHA